MYFLLPHWVPATWRSQQRLTRVQRSCKDLTDYSRPAANLPIYPLNHIVCTYWRTVPNPVGNLDPEKQIAEPTIERGQTTLYTFDNWIRK